MCMRESMSAVDDAMVVQTTFGLLPHGEFQLQSPPPLRRPQLGSITQTAHVFLAATPLDALGHICGRVAGQGCGCHHLYLGCCHLDGYATLLACQVGDAVHCEQFLSTCES